MLAAVHLGLALDLRLNVMTSRQKTSLVLQTDPQMRYNHRNALFKKYHLLECLVKRF